MSGGISAGTMAMMVATAAAAVYVTKQSIPKIPGVTAPEKPSAPPQASQAPEERAARATQGNAPGMVGGAPSGTMLTGAMGVDPSGLNLGKNTLLGQ